MIAPEPELDPIVELELLASRGLPPPSTWRFSPDGRHLAAFDDGCQIWTVPGDRHAGTVEPGDLDFDPCATWPPVVLLGRDPPPNPTGVRVEVVAGNVEVTVGDEPMRTLGCDSGWAPSGSTICARPIVAAVADPSGERLAVARLDPVEVEVWSLGESTDPTPLTLPATGSSVALLWPARGLIAALRNEACDGQTECSKPMKEACDGQTECSKPMKEDARLELWSWMPFDATAGEIYWFGDRGRDASAVHVDPLLRWLWVVGSAPVPHRPGHTREQTFGVDLQALDMRHGPLYWQGPETPSFGERLPGLGGRPGWAVGPATAWVEILHLPSPGWADWFEYHSMSTSSVMLAPVVHHRATADVGRQLDSYTWQWLGVEEGYVRLDTRACEPGWPDEETGRATRVPPCPPADVPVGCQVLAGPILPPGSGGVQASWIRCSKGRRAKQAGLWSWYDEQLHVFGSSGPADAPPLVWGSDAVALWTDARGLVIVDNQFGERFADADIDGIQRAALDAELDRVLVREAGRYVVMNLRDASSMPAIDHLAEAEFAAFDPSGARLALAWSKEIAVFDLASGQALARWVPPTRPRGLAWRQDSKVLFSGHANALPEQAWDPELGVRMPDADPSPALLADLARGQIDPSWRWSTDGSRFVRTLDGAWVVLDGSSEFDAVVASDARYQLPERASPYRVQVWSLRERDELLGPVVALDLVTDFRAPVLEPFVTGAAMSPMQIDRTRWEALIECAEHFDAGDPARGQTRICPND